MTDILGAYWTTAGPVTIRTGREWSLFDWEERCDRAVESGMTGLGLWHTDLVHLLETRSLADIGAAFRDRGLVDLELEFLDDWFVGADHPGRAAADERRRLLFDAAAALGAHHIKVGNLARSSASLAQLTDAFGALCRDAARHHDSLITYELMPFDINTTSLADVLQILDGAGEPNGGIAIDTWHLGKMAITAEDLRVIHPDRLLYVELSDGQVADMPDHSMETTRFRRLPGEGEFDIPGYVRVLAEIGYRGPWGVEVLSDALRALPIEEMFRRTVSTALAQFEGVRP
ncbi:sugar phosphate isomerase/epimerase family protein [Pseudonocardia sp. DLS-67]